MWRHIRIFRSRLHQSRLDWCAIGMHLKLALNVMLNLLIGQQTGNLKMLTLLKQVHHKLGLNNKQAQGILEFYKSTLEGSAKEMSVNMEAAQAEAANALRSEWGRAYDENLRKAASVAKTYLEPELLDSQLRDGTRLGDHPKIIKAFANIANLGKIRSQEAKDRALAPIKQAFEDNKEALQDLWAFTKDYLVPLFEFTLVRAIEGVGKAIATITNIIGRVVTEIKALVQNAVDAINFLIAQYNRLPFGNINALSLGGGGGAVGNFQMSTGSSLFLELAACLATSSNPAKSTAM